MPQGNDADESLEQQLPQQQQPPNIIVQSGRMAPHLYDNYNRWNGQPYVEGPPLEPLSCVPTEPRIDELLQKVSETQDLRTLEALHLRISSSMICSQHLEVFLPNLMALDLTGSDLSSLRDLGTQLRIKSLNVSRCGLHSLDGTTGFSQLLELVADENAIRTLEQVCNLSGLRKLSVRGNKIFSPDAVSFLFLCPSILELDMRDNPVAQMADYREFVIDTMPGLKILDCDAIPEPPTSATDLSLSSSEYSSSSTSGSRGRSRSRISNAVTFSDRAPVTGNIVATVRGRKSTSSSSLSSRSSTSMGSGYGGPSSGCAGGGEGDGGGDGDTSVPQ